MKKKPKFNIGDYVEAMPSELTYEHWNKPGNRPRNIIIKEKETRRGVIIGAIIRMMGTLAVSSYYSEEPPYFTAEKGVLFWQIRTGFLNKPFEALEEDIKLLEPVHLHCLMEDKAIPWKNTGWTDFAKKAQSEDMKSLFKKQPDLFPRDEKGRFKK